MDQGNTAFILIAAALVLLMTPGLAFFYGGLVKAKSVISMMMLSFGAMGLIGVLWVALRLRHRVPVGRRTRVPLVDRPGPRSACTSLLETPEGAAYPPLAFVAFQATFAIITVALVSGAIADRAKFGAWMVFAAIWATIVYFPVASWVFNFGLAEDGSFAYGGWITYGMQECFGVGAIDFAGGTAVHINAGAAALALALVLGKRVGFPKGVARPAQPAVRAARRRSAVVRLVRLQRRLRARGRQHRGARVRQHDRRSGRRAARLAGRREDQGRQADLGRRRLGRRRRPGRDHARVRVADPDLGDRARPRRRCGLRPRDRAEVQARLRRLARRRGHPPRRRPDRNAVPGLLRQRHRPDLQRRRARSCSSRRSRPSRS